jgi:hypothetical protein
MRRSQIRRTLASKLPATPTTTPETRPSHGHQISNSTITNQIYLTMEYKRYKAVEKLSAAQINTSAPNDTAKLHERRINDTMNPPRPSMPSAQLYPTPKKCCAAA